MSTFVTDAKFTNVECDSLDCKKVIEYYPLNLRKIIQNPRNDIDIHCKIKLTHTANTGIVSLHVKEYNQNGNALIENETNLPYFYDFRYIIPKDTTTVTLRIPLTINTIQFTTGNSVIINYDKSWASTNIECITSDLNNSSTIISPSCVFYWQ